MLLRDGTRGLDKGRRGHVEAAGVAVFQVDGGLLLRQQFRLERSLEGALPARGSPRDLCQVGDGRVAELDLAPLHRGALDKMDRWEGNEKSRIKMLNLV